MNRSSLGGECRSAAASSSVVTKKGGISHSDLRSESSLADATELQAEGCRWRTTAGSPSGPSHKGPTAPRSAPDASMKRPASTRTTWPIESEADPDSTNTWTRRKCSAENDKIGRI